jgi:UDP-hydrolysing UDP-N-acetyl-D-glucosamine 2-epimerase
MGEDPSCVFVTGCPSIDLTAPVLQDGRLDFDPIGKYGGVGDLKKVDGNYLVVMQHPVTNEHELALEHVNATLQVVKDLDMPAFWFWPNVDAGSDGTSRGIRRFREIEKPRNIRFFKNIPPEDFLKVLYNCKCIIGNSSVAIRECSFLGVPAVNIGSRQEGRDRGVNVVDVPHDYAAIKEAVLRQTQNGRYKSDPVYGDGNAGERIGELLAKVQLKIEKRLTY